MWCRVVFSGVLLGGSIGCSFDRGSELIGADGDGAGTPDGAPDSRIDAAPGSFDATPGEPDSGSSEVLIETLSIPCTGEWVTSSTSLQSGTKYRLVASGTCQVASGGGGYTSDAEWYWRDPHPNSPTDGASGVDIGIGVDDTVVDDSRSPKWGAYDKSSHTYEVGGFTGAGAPITVLFHEAFYDDNDGDLTLEIRGRQQSQ